MLPTKVHVNWPFISGEERKKKIFKMVAMATILDWNLQDTPMHPTKFQVNWRFGSGEEAKNRLS